MARTPDDPNERDERLWEALNELVHEEASQQASNAIDAGEGRAYLIAAGWNEAGIDARIAEMAPTEGGESHGVPS